MGGRHCTPLPKPALINVQIAAGYALALRLRYGYEQSLWNISARDLTLTTPRIAS
jgi:hypothetical protein